MTEILIGAVVLVGGIIVLIYNNWESSDEEVESFYHDEDWYK